MGLRGSRTFSVRGGSRTPATTNAELYNNNIDIGGLVSFPDGEYSNTSRGLYPRASALPPESITNDAIDIEGEYGDQTIGTISSISTPPPTGAQRPDAVSMDLDTDYPTDPEITNRARDARVAGALIEAVGGTINASIKHNNYVSENNMKIYQAQMTENRIQADAARAILREGNKAADRKGQALISAVAQGQSATGDLAKTAMSNEDVYAAQNAMNIEINAMRAIYGLNSEIITTQTNNRLSKINRNANIAQNIIGASAKVAVA